MIARGTGKDRMRTKQLRCQPGERSLQFSSEILKITQGECMASLIKLLGESRVDPNGAASPFQASAATLTSGNYVVVWSNNGFPSADGSGMAARAALFAPDGTPIGSEFGLNTTTAGDQSTPVVAALATGGFAAAWYSGQSIVTQRFASDGAKIDGELFLGTVGYYDTYSLPAISSRADGGWAVASGANGNIATYTIAPGGTVLASTQVDAGGFDNEPALTALAGGGFVLSWTDQSGLNGDPNVGLLGRVFDAGGHATGQQFRINSTTAGAEYSSSLASLSDGGFIAAWTENGPINGGISGGIRAQHFDAAGTKIGGEIAVSSLKPNAQASPDVTSLAWGGYLITWLDTSGTDGDYTTPSVRAQLFDADGTRLGDEVRINSRVTDAEQYAHVATLSGTSAVATWTAGGVVQRLLALPVVGSSGDDTLAFPASGASALLGRDGNDILNGSSGDDILIGGNGADTLNGGDGNDTADYSDSASPVTVDLATHIAHGGSAEGDTFSSIENLTGSALADSLTGDENANVLDGGAGDDMLYGGGGNDLLIGGTGNDFADGGSGIDTFKVQASRFSGGISFSATANGDVKLITSAGGTDTLRSIEFLQLDDETYALSDLITVGTSGADDLSAPNGTSYYGRYVAGLDGDDILRTNATSFTRLDGGAGNDTYYLAGSNAISLTTVIEQPGGGIDTVRLSSAGPYTLRYTIPTEVENVIVDSPLAAELFGNVLANRIVGNSADDQLNGNGGDDILEGKGGNDFFNGGDGNDIAVIASTFAASSVNLTDDGTIVVSSADGTDTLLYVETIRFSDRDIAASDYGVLGSSQNDILRGTAGRDVMFGYDGDDILDGGAGADVMDGGAGSDTYYVDNVNDIVRERQYSPTDIDMIITSVAYTAPENIEVLKLAEGATGTITGNATLIGNSLGNILIGTTGNEILDGGLGDDILDGSGGTYDVAVFHSNMAQSVLRIVGADLIVSGPDGKDTLRNMEVLRFIDGNIATAQIAPIVANYENWGGRDPNGAEASYWTGFLQRGGTLAQMKNAILDDPIGQANTRARVTDLYQTYGGRAPVAAEINVWNNNLHNGATFDTVRSAILNDPLGRSNTVTTVTSLYQTYGGRAPNAAELSYWDGAVKGGTDFTAVRAAILNDSLGQTHTTETVSALYRAYGGRDPTPAEITTWKGLIAAGADFGTVRSAILNDPLGQTHTAAIVTGLYRDYGGRDPSAGEISYWSGVINSGSDFTVVRGAILDDPLGQNHSDATIASIYQQYFGRAPSGAETGVWKGLIRGGIDFDTMRDTLLSDSGSAATGHRQLSATSGVDTFAIGHGAGATIAGFDPAMDRISLSGSGFRTIDPLDSAHARDVHAFDGATDVLIALDGNTNLLLHHVSLSQLSAADFLI